MGIRSNDLGWAQNLLSLLLGILNSSSVDPQSTTCCCLQLPSNLPAYAASMSTSTKLGFA